MSTMMNPIPLEDDRTEVAAIHPLRIWIKYKQVHVNHDKPKEEPVYETVSEEWVEWAKKGVQIPMTSSNAVKRLRRDPQIWAAIEPFYDNWKRGGDADPIPAGHTPLAVVAFLTKDHVEALKAYKVFSVEDFATMPDDQMRRIPFPNIVAMRDRARKYLETKEVAAAVDELRKDKDDQISKLVAELEAMKETVRSVQGNAVANVGGDAGEFEADGQPKKRGRGRPRKAQQDAAA